MRSDAGGPQDHARDRGIFRSRDENFGFKATTAIDIPDSSDATRYLNMSDITRTVQYGGWGSAQ